MDNLSKEIGNALIHNYAVLNQLVPEPQPELRYQKLVYPSPLLPAALAELACNFFVLWIQGEKKSTWKKTIIKEQKRGENDYQFSLEKSLFSFSLMDTIKIYHH